MANDWIKMRPSLINNPKVNGIARCLERSFPVSQVLSTGFTGTMDEIVTRNVMRNVTIASLLIVWGAANEHTDDGVFKNTDMEDIDDMVGIPGFAEAMSQSGWLEFDEQTFTVTLPNFNEYNTCGRNRSAEKNAERQRRYRERHKENSNAFSNVTNDVTNNAREEKRREDINIAFSDFWSVYPNKKGKVDAEKKWPKLSDQEREQALADCRVRYQDTEKQFIPHGSTYLNKKPWNDELPASLPSDRFAGFR